MRSFLRTVLITIAAIAMAVPAMALDFDTLKVNGDLRLRVERDDDRNRTRARFRLGAELPVTEKLMVGFGLASGSADPRSTNQTLGGEFSSKGIQLDLAYIEYQASANLALTAGKFKSPLWSPSSLLWDGDIRPEGLAATYQTPIENLTLTAGVFLLDEVDGSDPTLIPIQAVYTHLFSDKMGVTVGAAYYAFLNEKGAVFDHSAGSNSLDANGALVNDYDALALSAEFAALDTVWNLPYFGLFGEYVQNIATGDNGLLAGVSFGDVDTKGFGKWQATAAYRIFNGNNAWLDVLPDSDFRGGATEGHGFQAGLTYGLSKNASLAANHYGGDGESLTQLDFVLKF